MHAWDEEHRVEWEGVRILEQSYWKRRVLEANWIKKSNKNWNFNFNLVSNHTWLVHINHVTTHQQISILLLFNCTDIVDDCILRMDYLKPAGVVLNIREQIMTVGATIIIL